MKHIEIISNSHAYPVYIGENIRFKLGSYITGKYSSILIIADQNAGDLYLNDLIDSLQDQNVYTAIIPAGERSKSIDNFYRLQTKAIEYNLDRKSLIIALGGGVIGDLAGFTAATYMRGVDYIQVPTTILAHDSSVGGKVAINHELGKNLIGSFYPPQMVLYDVATLETLPVHEVRSGYAELIKEALIADAAYFENLLLTDVKNIPPDELADHLYQGIKIKAAIVEEDEKEAGIRKYLNLGHTLAHALEAELGYGSMTHGEAVAVGLLFALYVSENLFSAVLPRKVLLDWLKKNNYPLQLPPLEEEVLINKMKSDKKTVNGNIQMVLLKQTAEPCVQEIADNDLKRLLTSFLQYMNEQAKVGG